MSLAERRKAKALEEAVPAQAVKLNGRSTRGQRISDLQGEDAEADETFWSQGAWQEADDSDFSSEEEEPDKFDDDFNESESDDDDDDGAEETNLRKNERAAKRKRPTGGAYKEPKRVTAAWPKKAVKPAAGENGASGGTVVAQSSRTGGGGGSHIHHAPIKRSVRASTKTKTERSLNEREGEAKKARAELLKRTKTQQKKLKGQFTQEQLLLEAVQTEQENMRWILKQQRLEDEAKEDEGRPKTHIALASRWMSRRGCLDSVLFPSALPAVLSQPPAREDPDSSDADNADGKKRSRSGSNGGSSRAAADKSSEGSNGGRGGGRSSPPRSGKKKHVCKVTGRPAKYRDPLTGFPYADAAAFRVLRRRFGPSAQEGDDEQDPQDRDAKGADGKGVGARTGSDVGTAASGTGAAAAAGGGAAAAAAGGSSGSVPGESAGNAAGKGTSKDSEKKAKSSSGKGKGKAGKKDAAKNSSAAAATGAKVTQVTNAEAATPAVATAAPVAADDCAPSSGVSVVANGTAVQAPNTGAATGTTAPVRSKVEGKSTPAKAEGKEQKGTKRVRKQGSGAKSARPTKRPFFAPSPAPATSGGTNPGGAAAGVVPPPPVAGEAEELELVPLKLTTSSGAYREPGLSAMQRKVAATTSNAGMGSVPPAGYMRVAPTQKVVPAGTASAPSPLGGLQRSTVAPRSAAAASILGRTTPSAAVAAAAAAAAAAAIAPPPPAYPSSTAAVPAVAPSVMAADGGAAEVANGWENVTTASAAPPVYGWQQGVPGGTPTAGPEQSTPR